jgi:hypothetical protein
MATVPIEITKTSIVTIRRQRVFIIGIVCADKIMYGSQSRGNSRLNLQAILGRQKKYSEAALQNTKYPLNNITSRCVTKIK